MKNCVRIFLTLIFVVASLFIVAACDISAPDDGSSKAETKDITLVSFTNLYMDEDGTDFNDAKKWYEAEKGGKVHYKQYPANLFITKMITLIGSGNSPDIAYGRWAEMPKLAAMEILQPVDAYISPSETNYPKIAEKYVFNNEHYAARIEQVQPYVIWYNKNILNEYGAPDPYSIWKNNPDDWNWSIFEEIAVATTDDRNHDGETDLWGFGGMPYFGYSNSAATLQIEGEDIRIAWKDKAYLETMEFMQKLRFDLEVASPDNNFGYSNFKSGDVAMAQGTFEFVWGSASDMNPDHIGCVPYPAGPSFDGNYSCMTNILGLVNGAKNPGGAIDFIKFMNENDLVKYPEGAPIGNPTAEKFLTDEHKEVLYFVRENAVVVMTDGWGDWAENYSNQIWINLFWNDNDIVSTLDSLEPIYRAQIDETLSFSMPEVKEFNPKPAISFENKDMGYLTFDDSQADIQEITEDPEKVIDGQASLVFSTKEADELAVRSSSSKLFIPSYRTYKVTFDWLVLDVVDEDTGCDFYAAFRSEANLDLSSIQVGSLAFGGISGDFGQADMTVTISTNTKDNVLVIVTGLNGGTVAIDNLDIVEIVD